MAVNVSKNTVTGYNLNKAGKGYAYDSWRTYDGDDNQYYDAYRVAETPVNVSKNTVTGTNVSKS
jgi:hypothetical protein